MPSANLQTAIETCSALFGTLCILSAAPFAGVPFPNRAAADYYRAKSRWMSAIFGQRLSPVQAGYMGAAVRIVVGAGTIYPPTREAVLLLNGAGVLWGTVRAVRDGRPLIPQFGMLGAVAFLVVLNRLARG